MARRIKGTPKAKYWQGVAPRKCDICDSPLIKGFYDAKTTKGLWGCMCQKCFKLHGWGLGTGLGQKYEKQADGQWLKTGG